jgi:GNAT superfamily N-acetyltransferase
MEMTVDLASQVELRAVHSADLPFLRRLYTSSRAGELALTGLEPEQLEALLEMQFGAREQYYSEQFPARDDLVVLVNGQAGGRLCVDRNKAEIHIIDIALSPEHQGAGIATALITSLQQEATAAGVPVALHVAAANPAVHLYGRLGFVINSGDGVYNAMRWQPQAAGAGHGG